MRILKIHSCYLLVMLFTHTRSGASKEMELITILFVIIFVLFSWFVTKGNVLLMRRIAAYIVLFMLFAAIALRAIGELL